MFPASDLQQHALAVARLLLAVAARFAGGWRQGEKRAWLARGGRQHASPLPDLHEEEGKGGNAVGKEEGEGSDAADEEEAKGPPVRKKRRNAAAGELRRESGGGTTASFREANSTQNRRGRGRYCRRRAVGAVIPVGIVMRFHLSMSRTSKQWN